MVRTLRLAISSLERHRLRTLLTVLGIGIGIAAVICTAALGTASTARIQSQIDAVGEDFLWIRAGSLNLGGVRTGAGAARTLTADDAVALVGQVPEITKCSPISSGREQLVSGGVNWNTRYQGVLPSFFEIRRRTPVAGTLFTAADVASAARVAVLGSGVAERMFQSNPIGRTIRMGRFPFQVIGVLSSRGTERSGGDRDDVVFVPFSTANRNFDRRTWVSDIMCAVQPAERMASAEVQAATLLRIRHNVRLGERDDFEIQHPIEIIELRANTLATMGRLLVGIAAISLIVGGVGIMNIMLVSVAERKREIGIRLALGARIRDIRSQFLLEAAALGLIGGGCGIGFGFVGAWVLRGAFGWSAAVSPETAVGATLAAVGTALVFGWLPAHRASALDPIDAIRVEV